MSVTRAALAAWIVLVLALGAVFLEVRGVELRYRLVAARKRLHEAVLEQRAALLTVQAARAPGGLAKRAHELGIDPGRAPSATAAAPRAPAPRR